MQAGREAGGDAIDGMGVGIEAAAVVEVAGGGEEQQFGIRGQGFRMQHADRGAVAGHQDLRAAVAAAMAGMQRTIDARGFTVTLAAGDPVSAMFDAAAIPIIVHNLLDNVLKYAAHCEPKEARVEVLREGNLAVIRVADHGPGIPAAERTRVFERFYRIEDEATAHRPGTGLGLALVRELAEAHGGVARIVPAGERGTVVEVCIPIVDSRSEPPQPAGSH